MHLTLCCLTKRFFPSNVIIKFKTDSLSPNVDDENPQWAPPGSFPLGHTFALWRSSKYNVLYPLIC